MEFSGAQPTVDLTYSDVFLVPRRSAVTSRLQVDLAPHDGTPATLPLVAANMNSVTGPRIAAVLARRGALGVLPQDLPLQELDAAIRDVKGQPVLWDTPLVLPPEATVADALRLLPAAVGHGIVVAHGAAPIAV
uniref:IMP dehydrogenase n=2 Tax=unclassified Microbacterium TaxID=2609290 RepID=UPI0028AA0D78